MRRKGCFRVLGPYRSFKRWRFFRVGPDGSRRVESLPEGTTEEEARAIVAANRRNLPGRETVNMAMLRYEDHLRTVGNRGWALKDDSVKGTLARLQRMLPDPDQEIDSIGYAQLQRAYQSRVDQKVSADTHRGELAETRTFFKWCVKQKFVRHNPTDGIDPIGRRKRGIESKTQLRHLEVQKLRAHVTGKLMAQKGGRVDGNLAVLVLLETGLRVGELLKLRVRDLDQRAGVWLLCVDTGKTRAAERVVNLPDYLAIAIQRFTAGRDGNAWMWPSGKATKQGHRTKTWIRRRLATLCEDAGVPVICPHGMRGTWATMARQAGHATIDISQSMGHEHPGITERAYIDPEAERQSQQKQAFKVLQGGAR